MNEWIRGFVKKHVSKLEGTVLEVGSLDVNGNVSDLVPNAIRTDMRPGKNVDVVCKAEDLHWHFDDPFDAVLSLDALEHMQDWRGAVRGMWEVLKTDGWLVITMANQRKGRHAYPDDYWRADWKLIQRIFPNAQGMTMGTVSMGWTVQKKGDLPNLDEIELIPVP
jgi:predicted SAM-dependent methyltransferase